MELLSKARLVILSNLPGLLDKVIDLNSIQALKQHIRDLEKAKEELEDSTVMAEADVETLKDELSGISAQVKELNENINFILTDDVAENDHLALPLESRLVGLEDDMAARNEQLAEAEETHRKLVEGLSQVRAKMRLPTLSRLKLTCVRCARVCKTRIWKKNLKNLIVTYELFLSAQCGLPVLTYQTCLLYISISH